MFRSKKSSGNGADAVVGPPAAVITAPPPEAEAVGPPEPAEPPEPLEPRPLPRRPLQPAMRTLGNGTPLDLNRRHGEPAAQRDAQPVVREKTLVIGKEVELSGEIKACQRLIVEGHVQVSSSDCRHLLIGPTGVFRGRIEVGEAEVFGRFDGELVARERLIVRSSGHVAGTIRYGAIVVDAGGEISGEIAAIEKGARGRETDAAAEFITPGAAAVS
jgi:cytoskeletal protein CcmA (bactofilin family)